MVFAGLVLFSCGAMGSQPTLDFRDHSARTSSRDVKLPKALVTRIEREYKEFLSNQGVVSKEGLRRELLDMTVELTQDRPAALHENTRVATPLGGGVIDFAEIVTRERGAFRVRLIPQGEKRTPLSGVRVFFVSQARERKIGGDTFGAGCGRFMEVTTLFNQKMSDPGLEVYTAEQRYVSVLSGTFVVTKFTPEALYVGSVSFMDSRFSGLTCEST